jgi:hypothetical protein
MRRIEITLERAAVVAVLEEQQQFWFQDSPPPPKALGAFRAARAGLPGATADCTMWLDVGEATGLCEYFADCAAIVRQYPDAPVRELGAIFERAARAVHAALAARSIEVRPGERLS